VPPLPWLHSILHQIEEGLLAQALIERNEWKIARVFALHAHRLFAGKTRGNNCSTRSSNAVRSAGFGCACNGGEVEKLVTRALSRLTSVEMYPLTRERVRRTLAISGHISAEPLITPRGCEFRVLIQPRAGRVRRAARTPRFGLCVFKAAIGFG